MPFQTMLCNTHIGVQKQSRKLLRQMCILIRNVPLDVEKSRFYLVTNFYYSLLFSNSENSQHM